MTKIESKYIREKSGQPRFKRLSGVESRPVRSIVDLKFSQTDVRKVGGRRFTAIANLPNK